MSAPELPFFVYGTLRPGEVNHDLLLRGRTLREEPARLAGAVLYQGPGYPYAVEEPGGTVAGELVTPLPGPTRDCSPSSTGWRSTCRATRATCTSGSSARWQCHR